MEAASWPLDQGLAGIAGAAAAATGALCRKNQHYGVAWRVQLHPAAVCDDG